jgi:hypothetical protein
MFHAIVPVIAMHPGSIWELLLVVIPVIILGIVLGLAFWRATASNVADGEPKARPSERLTQPHSCQTKTD